MDEGELLGAVDREFERTGAGLERWPDPHAASQSPAEDEYSRVTNPERFRLLGARFEAWVDVLTGAGVARIERDVDVTWHAEPDPILNRTDCLIPAVIGGLQIVVGRSRVAEMDGIGLWLGVGDPALSIGWLPHCGCDACNDGSDYELEQLDSWLAGIVRGTFRHLSRRGETIVVTTGEGWTGSGLRRGRDGSRILSNPRGWHEVSGAPWFA